MDNIGSCNAAGAMRCATSRGALCWTLMCVLMVAGCGQERRVETIYGQRRGEGTRSVNGTLVLARLFERAGCRVSSWRRLSPKLDRDQVIVWAPDRFGAPEEAEVEYLEKWLNQAPNRTLIFIGRDYDAAVEYWRLAVAQTRGSQRLRARQRWARTNSAHVTRRQTAAENAECDWFALEPQQPGRSLATVSGTLAGPAGSMKVDLPLNAQLELATDPSEADWQPPLRSELLLTSDRHVLAARLTRPNWPGSQIIVVADGSWLLNLPQVDDANRQLAANLVATCLPADGVCFLESGEGGLRISESDAELPLMLRLFTVWPISLFMFHLVLAGLIFCFYVWPIFGRPRHLPEERLSDFGKHITAVGELLERGQDYAHANAQIRQFQELAAAKPSVAAPLRPKRMM